MSRGRMHRALATSRSSGTSGGSSCSGARMGGCTSLGREMVWWHGCRPGTAPGLGVGSGTPSHPLWPHRCCCQQCGARRRALLRRPDITPSRQTARVAMGHGAGPTPGDHRVGSRTWATTHPAEDSVWSPRSSTCFSEKSRPTTTRRSCAWTRQCRGPLSALLASSVCPHVAAKISVARSAPCAWQASRMTTWWRPCRAGIASTGIASASGSRSAAEHAHSVGMRRWSREASRPFPASAPLGGRWASSSATGRFAVAPLRTELGEPVCEDGMRLYIHMGRGAQSPAFGGQRLAWEWVFRDLHLRILPKDNCTIGTCC
mmetsp:Transcript_47825/g.102513  ORF Transcript_47825/g.102513 Transcript_47825/m.102513 type:complete len:317 (-) Transcript_47825:438-1388(-)